MNNNLKLVILTPSGIYLEKEIYSISCKSEEGEIEILSFHSEYLANLEISIIKIINLDETIEEYSIGGGAIHVIASLNEVKLIVGSINSASSIDLEIAKKNKKYLEEKLENNLSTSEHKNVERELKKTINNINLKEGKK